MSSMSQASLLLHSYCNSNGGSSSSSSRRCLTARRLTPPDTLLQPLLCRGPRLLRCSYRDDFKAVEDAPPAAPFTPSELNLPLASQAPSSQSGSQAQPQQEETMEGEAKKAVKNDNVLEAASRALDELTVAQLALYGAVFAGGLFFLEAILNSFEVLPLFPETLQLIGVLYSILFASRMFQGKPVTLTPSPIKAITEMVERDGTKLQRTSLLLPQDLDARVLAVFEKLRNERDRAVNEMESLKTKVADYARIVAEKEALEAVAMQLAQERDEAIKEVVELKEAVDAMSERMRLIEKTLQQELGPLRESTRALETVAVQLASERDTALKELSELKKDLDLAKCKEEEKIALENLAFQLTKERDQATSENETLKKMLAEIQNAGDSLSGLSPEEELSLKDRIAAGSQYIDLDKPYDNQKEQADNFVSHLVDEYGAPPSWTKKYLKQFLELSASKSKTNLESSSQVEAEISS